MRKLFHTSWISVLALALLAGGAVYYCGWTESGLQHLARLFSRRIGPVTLVISGARGTLHGGLHVDRVVVEHDRVRVEALGLDGRIALLPLLWQSIRVTQLHLDYVQVHVLPYAYRGGPPWKPHFLVGLLSIDAERVAADRAELITPGATSLVAERLSAAAQIGSARIRIFDSTLHYSGFEVRSAGTVRAANPIGLRGSIRLSLDTPGHPPWLANTQIDGNLNLLQVTGALQAPFNADYRGEARELGGDFHWQGASQVRDLDLRAWGAGGALGIISGALLISGDRHGFAARGSLEPPGLKAGPLAVDFAGSYAARVLNVDHVAFTHRASNAQLSAAGRIGFASGGPRLDLQAQWRAFRWPLTDSKAAVRSSNGSLVLSGTRPYALTANGVLQLFTEPPLPFRATGQLGRDALVLETATVDAYGGQAQLRGSLSWSPAPGWSMNGAMHALNVAALRPAISGRLNFLFSAAGQGFGKGSALQARFTDIGGNVRGQHASGHAGLALSGNDWLLQQVHVQLGATRIDADGRLGTHPDLHFAIDAADLALLSNGAQGRLQAAGQVGGDERNPLLLMHLSGTGLRYGRVALRSLAGDIDFDPRGSGHANVDLRIERLTADGHTIDRARFNSSGTAAAHRFTVLVDAAPVTVRSTGTGSFSDGAWRAQLAEFTASDGRDLHLALESPATLVAALNGSELQLARLCLHDSQATLCVAGSLVPEHRALTVSGANMPLRTLTAGAAGDTDFEGTLNLEAHAEASGAALWTGAFSATLADAQLHHRLSGGRIEAFSLGTGKVQAGLDAMGLTADVALDAGTDGSISGHLVASRGAGAWRQWPLSGELHLQTKSLGFIDSYVAQIDRASGLLEANLDLSGTAAALELNGELKVSGAELDAYQINLALRDVNLDARLRDNTLQLAGSGNAGNDGHARFDGELVWRNGLPNGQVHLAGENLRIVNVPEARIQASPDVNMRFSGRRIDVTGTVTLPYARLQRPDQLTNAVRASGDEVIVGAGGAAPSDEFHVFSDVTLRLGERVTIDTLGLAGRLSGSVRAVTNDTGLSLGTGEVRVEEGKYTYYGRQLDIQRGRLLFNSGPLSDPAIDLSAVKKFPDITAGVNVRGTLRDPRVTFFSDPPVAQSQIISLLLAGGSLETVQNTADPSQRNSAARNAALLQGSALVVQQFGSKVGIQDVGVESDLNNDTALVLGRYLSPRLYVSYGISLAESINTFKMRYTIGDHWTIKTEAGLARSADLVYTIER